MDITTRPAQESTSIADSHKATIELAARMTAFACLGVARAVLDPENKYSIVGYILGSFAILNAIDLGISWLKQTIAQRNYRTEYNLLHPGK